MPIGMRGQDAAKKMLRDRVRGYLDKLDLEIPERPVDDKQRPLTPRLPVDITRVSLEEIGRLYGQFIAMAQYASAQLGLVDVDHIESDYEAEQAEARYGLVADGNNATERKYNTQLHPGLMSKAEIKLEKKARKVMLTALVEGYRKSADCLSREMSRRNVELE